MSLLCHCLHFLPLTRSVKFVSWRTFQENFVVYLGLRNIIVIRLAWPGLALLSSQPFGDCTETDHCDGELVVTVLYSWL